jgi:hypothetical protein
VQWSRVAAFAGATNLYGSAHKQLVAQMRGARGGDGAVQRPTPHNRSHTLQTPPSAILGFEDKILLRNGGLAASPPVGYTLETAEQCRATGWLNSNRMTLVGSGSAAVPDPRSSVGDGRRRSSVGARGQQRVGAKGQSFECRELQPVLHAFAAPEAFGSTRYSHCLRLKMTNKMRPCLGR